MNWLVNLWHWLTHEATSFFTAAHAGRSMPWSRRPSLKMKRVRARTGATPFRCRINTMTGAQFEISIDGVPRTYRDRKDLALLAAQILSPKTPRVCYS